MPHQLSNQTRAHPSAIKSLVSRRCLQDTLCGISSSFPLLSPSEGQVAHVLLTRPPLTWGASSPRPFDLHVLGTPPAFVLSQDQTLKKSYLKPFGLKPLFSECCSWHHSNSFPLRYVSVPRPLGAFAWLLHCLIYKVQRTPLSGELDKYTTPICPCQAFSRIIFRLFFLPQALGV